MEAEASVHERHFSARSRAFGRLAMRIFEPAVMDAAHWHGHVEINLLRGARMTYELDGTAVEIPEGRLSPPLNERSDDRGLGAAHVRHVVAMVRHILENLTGPMTNSDVTAVTGLHENYALSIFSRTMRMPMKRFIIRMRLIRARALLAESPLASSAVAEMSGFASISQFYAHFRAGYGISPHALRTRTAARSA